MDTNQLPRYDMSDNPTGCCPRFKAEGWDGQELHFEDKLFVKARTRSIFHIPVNFGSVFPRTFAAIEAVQEKNEDDFIVMSQDTSPWTGEHYFAVDRDIPGQEMARLSGDFMTRVFEGPYKDMGKWDVEMAQYVASRGKVAEKSYFFYTTCPKCAKHYGKNYVVAVTQVH
ncbi:MAG: hydrolase [Thermoleophilia bacterium]